MVAKSAGSFLGGILNNPGAVVIALGLGALLFFRGDIRKAFASIGEGFGKVELPAITLPTINFPEFPKFPEFPEITFPEFPSFPDIFGGGGAAPIIIPGPGGNVPPDLMCECGTNISQNAAGVVTTSCIPCQTLGMDPGLAIEPSDAELFVEQFPEPFIPLPTPPIQGGIQVGGESPFGGGPSFIGGQTTFGDNLIDTLGEVLNIFSSLSASQAADALAEFPGLTGNEFAQINPDIINISSAEGDPIQNILNASGGFSGLTPEEIALNLTGGNISNF